MLNVENLHEVIIQCIDMTNKCSLGCFSADVDVEKPDEKSIMTYVAQFLKAYPEAGEDPAVSRLYVFQSQKG